MKFLFNSVDDFYELVNKEVDNPVTLEETFDRLINIYGDDPFLLLNKRIFELNNKGYEIGQVVHVKDNYHDIFIYAKKENELIKIISVENEDYSELSHLMTGGFYGKLIKNKTFHLGKYFLFILNYINV